MSQFSRHFIACFGILTCAIFAVVTFRLFVSSEMWGLATNWKAFNDQRPLDLVVIGSSRTRQGIDIDLLERSTGCKGFAFAYNGLSPEMIEVVARQVAESSLNKDALIVIEAYGFMLYRPGVLQDSRLFLDMPLEGKLRLLQIARRGLGGIDSALAYWNLLFRTDNELLLTAPIYRAAQSVARAAPAHVEGERDAGRSQGAIEELHHLPDDVQENRTPDLSQVNAIQTVARTLSASGYRVIFYDPPYPQPVYLDERTQSAITAARNAVAETGLEFLEMSPQFPIGDRAMFADPTHLSAAGRRVLTRALGSTLNLACGRVAARSAGADSGLGN